LLLGLSLLPVGKLPEIDLWSELFGTDKLVHALIYGVFTVLLYLPLRSWRIFGGLTAVSFAAAYGAAMEWLQFVSRTGRTYDTADMLANGLGALIGYLVIRFFVKSTRNEL
jgi:VanZ family protein